MADDLKLSAHATVRMTWKSDQKEYLVPLRNIVPDLVPFYPDRSKQQIADAILNGEKLEAKFRTFEALTGI